MVKLVCDSTHIQRIIAKSDPTQEELDQALGSCRLAEHMFSDVVAQRHLVDYGKELCDILDSWTTPVTNVMVQGYYKKAGDLELSHN